MIITVLLKFIMNFFFFFQARFLCRGGGYNNVNSLVCIIIKRLLTSVAMQYSLEGRKGKMKFCDESI